MYQNLRSSKKKVEAILIEDKDVEIIEKVQEKFESENTDNLKRKRIQTGNIKTQCKSKESQKKVISNKAVTSKNRQLESKTSSKITRKHSSGDSASSEALSDDDFVDKTLKKNPTSLFEEDESRISNQKIFGFQTPKRKTAMMLKAEESAKNCQTGSTPTHSKNLTASKSNTPAHSTSSKMITPSTAKRNSVCSKILSTPKTSKPSVQSKTPLSAKISGKTPRTLNLKGTSGEEKENEYDTRRLNIPKTPYSLRTKLKKRISLENKLDKYGSDDSGSEFEASSDESSESSEEESNKSADESPSSAPVQKKPRIILKITNQNQASVELKSRRKDVIKKEPSYIFKSDDYFTHKSGNQKNKTSNNTLSKTPQISREKMSTLLNNMKDSHELCKKELNDMGVDLFLEWLLFLRENFNILLHGFGSKYKLINSFCKKILSRSKILLINGFFPDLTLKEILEMIIIDLLGLKEAPQDIQLALEIIKKKLSSKSVADVFLVIHNIDGMALRGSKQQSLLSQLATIPKVHIIASIDHISAPLLWDNSKLGQFNFVWFDVTNYAKYEIETSYESSLLLEQSSGKLVKSSMANVFKSLNSNARQIFMLIVTDHIDNKTNKQYQGVSFKNLYSNCRKSFLVTSDLTLRTQLTEFLDHELIKWRNDKEHLYIPINLHILEDFKQKQIENQE